MSHAVIRVGGKRTIVRPCIAGGPGCLGAGVDNLVVNAQGGAECPVCWAAHSKWDQKDPGGPHLAVSVAKLRRDKPAHVKFPEGD